MGINFKGMSSNRPLTSYSKVQIFISNIIRGKKAFIKWDNIKDKTLLNVGCGPFPKENFINLEYTWAPNIDICWNIVTKPYPLKDQSLEGIFTEHCLEHIPFESCVANLKEFYRLLRPGGIARIVVPDGEIYCDLYNRRKSDKSINMPYGEQEATGMISINRIFRGNDHLFIYDYETMRLLLEKAGFKNIEKQRFRKGADPRLLIDRKEREVESLYVEAIKT
jgi:predicted SAM-dependent methyltransferase